MKADRSTFADGTCLSEAVERLHPDPFRSVSRADLLRQAERADQLSASGAGSALTVELMRLLVLLGPRNGHSAIFPLDSHRSPLHAFPLHLYEFEDGVFVVAAEPAELVGCELLAVAGVPIEELDRVLAPVVAHDNEWTIRARRPTFLVTAEVLQGLGILDQTRQASFHLRTPSGKRRTLELDPLAAGEYHGRIGGGVRLPCRPAPDFLRRRDEPRWLEFDAEHRAVHIGYNLTRGDTVALAREVEAVCSASRVKLLILDLRHNGGGNNRTYGPLFETLERLSAQGGASLAVLTSRVTFSAAMQLVVDLEQRTPAVFIGEPTGGSPNQFGDATTVPLATSGLTGHVATIEWKTAGESDDRVAREPDVFVPLQSDSFFAAADVTLAAALDYFA